MSRGPGRIQRFIQYQTNHRDRLSGSKMPVLLNSWTLSMQIYKPRPIIWGWRPSRAQRQAVTRAMRRFVSKHQQFALAGGQGRKCLYLYEPDDQLSEAWAKLSVENRKHIPLDGG